MFKVQSFMRAIEKLDELAANQSSLCEFISKDGFLLSKENRLDDAYFAGFQYWIMINFIHHDTEIVNEFKKYNINNKYSMAWYIMRGFWRFWHNKPYSLESIINEDVMKNILE